MFKIKRSSKKKLGMLLSLVLALGNLCNCFSVNANYDIYLERINELLLDSSDSEENFSQEIANVYQIFYERCLGIGYSEELSVQYSVECANCFALCLRAGFDGTEAMNNTSVYFGYYRAFFRHYNDEETARYCGYISLRYHLQHWGNNNSVCSYFKISTLYTLYYMSRLDQGDTENIAAIRAEIYVQGKLKGISNNDIDRYIDSQMEHLVNVQN